MIQHKRKTTRSRIVEVNFIPNFGGRTGHYSFVFHRWFEPTLIYTSAAYETLNRKRVITIVKYLKEKGWLVLPEVWGWTAITLEY